MPIPLPNLDDRRWEGLVEEGRAMIPVHAPSWTDHNAHDPGITLIELFAWLAEMTVYRLNRVPARHRRKFLELVGFPPRPPVAARGMLRVNSSAALLIPSGAEFEATDPRQQPVALRSLRATSVSPVALSKVLVDAGAGPLDRTADWRDGLPILALGPNPSSNMALYLGFEVLAASTPVALGFRLSGPGNDAAERERLIAEAAAQQQDCLPLLPPSDCGQPAPAVQPALPPHHSARLVWEAFTAGSWQAVTPSFDDTRSLTLDGIVEVTPPAGLAKTTVGPVATPYFYLRCRLASGAWDAAPVLLAVAANVLAAEQAVPARETFVIAAGVLPAGPAPVFAPGTVPAVRPSFTVDAKKVIQSLIFAAPGAPEIPVLRYQAPAAALPGEITLDLEMAGTGTGFPDQQVELRQPRVDAASLRVYTLAAGIWSEWTARPDFDASGRADRHYVLDPTTGVLRFGSGEQGLAPPANCLVLASYRTTLAEAGNLDASRAVKLLATPRNLLLLGNTPPAVTASWLASPAGGAAAEDLASAAGRAVETVHAHQRLLDIAAGAQSVTLDQIDRTRVRSLRAPGRAVNLLDLERIALETPGTRIARARAWASLHPAYPCLHATGVVTVVVVPEVPPGAPEPSPGLLDAVRRYLNRRRTITTRLEVVGPQYLTVEVRARVRLRPGAGAAKVQARILQALHAFLDPLAGGPAGLGWPFGRDVYRSEILELLDSVAGVDHVLSLSLRGGSAEARCGDVSVCKTWLVRSGQHAIEVQS